MVSFTHYNMWLPTRCFTAGLRRRPNPKSKGGGIILGHGGIYTDTQRC